MSKKKDESIGPRSVEMTMEEFQALGEETRRLEAQGLVPSEVLDPFEWLEEYRARKEEDSILKSILDGSYQIQNEEILSMSSEEVDRELERLLEESVNSNRKEPD